MKSSKTSLRTSFPNLALNRRHMLALTSSAALAPLAGCGGSSDPNKAFEKIGATWLKESARTSPAFATYLGDHDFDDRLNDVTATGRAARARVRADARAALAGIDRTQLSRDNQVDAVMLTDRLDAGDFEDDKLQSWAWDPLIYSDLAGGSLYGLMARDFAPLPERLLSAAARMEGLPDLLAQTREALDARRVPAIHARTYSSQNAGAVAIIDGLILNQAEALSGADKSRLADAAETAKAAIADHQDWIDSFLVPEATGDFRLGASLYDQKLRFSIDAPTPRADLAKQAKAGVEAIHEEMYAIARDVIGGASPGALRDQKLATIRQALDIAASSRPPREGLVEATRAALEETTDWTRQADLISLPDAPVQVIVMPEFQQGSAVAYCDSPGPLDRKLDTFYAVSPVPKDWTDEQAASFLGEYNTYMLYEMAVHEAMPGHYVQLWHANKHPNLLRAVLGSGTFIEGWACYAEDMMIEQGFGADEPMRRLTNLKMRLRSTTNALLDQGVHVDGWSEAQAMAFMTGDAFQEEREAAGKWTRARVSSGQLSTYFVGMTQHHAVRREIESGEGDSFNLKAYHDRVLSFGSPPVRLARAMMLDEAVA
ncbi:MAG: DUF885 domain-containing protein [Hyphomonadaceae bacterium]